MSPYARGKNPNTIQALREAAASPIVRQRAREGMALRRQLNEMIDRKCQPAAEEALDFAIAVMRGQPVGKARKPNQGEDPATYAALVPDVGPTIRERLEAAMWIFKQRNGEPKALNEASLTAVLEPSGGLLPAVSFPLSDLSVYSDDELTIMEALLAKMPEGEKIVDSVDAEFTEVKKP